MKDEIKEILEEIRHTIEISDYKNHYHLNEYFEVEYIDKLLDYITNLQEKLEEAEEKIRIYEAPADLTLFYMWLDEKAKDKMKQLQEENERLKNDIEEISVSHFSIFRSYTDYKSRNEKAIEYINSDEVCNKWEIDGNIVQDNLLNILEGENK